MRFLLFPEDPERRRAALAEMARIIGRQAAALRELKAALADLEGLNPELGRLGRKLAQIAEPAYVLGEIERWLSWEVDPAGEEELA